MGNRSSAKRERKQVIRHVAKYIHRSLELLPPLMVGIHNERNVDRYLRNKHQRNARCEDGLSSAFKESSGPTAEEEEKCFDIQDATLTFVDGDDDLDFLCADYKSLRAKMSCGHAVTPMSLTDWCRRQLDEGECRFVCGQPNCKVEWKFDEVCKMALLTTEEMKYFEKKMFSNAAKDFLKVKSCPGCQCLVMRTNLSDQSVRCTVCTADKKRTFIFCWQCLREWKGPAQRSGWCGNDDCYNPLKVLKSSPDITFKDVKGVTGCPSIRACPTCGLLVEHNRIQCKNVVCDRCKVEFCFVCLKLTKECQKLSPGSYYQLCSSSVAPRQTSMPVWQRT